MATIGYNEGYYSRSKWNDLAFQAEVIVTAVSSAQAQGSVIISGSSVISAVSDASVVGPLFKQTLNLFLPDKDLGPQELYT